MISGLKSGPVIHGTFPVIPVLSRDFVNCAERPGSTPPRSRVYAALRPGRRGFVKGESGSPHRSARDDGKLELEGFKLIHRRPGPGAGASRRQPGTMEVPSPIPLVPVAQLVILNLIQDLAVRLVPTVLRGNAYGFIRVVPGTRHGAPGRISSLLGRCLFR